MQIEYRIAGMEDLDEIFALVTGAIHIMNEQGIFQWDEYYPDRDILREDIAKEQLRVGTVEGQIAVIYVLNQECDEAYQTGRWMHEKEPFYVIHRLCVNPAFQNKGVAGSTMLHIEQELLAMGITAIRLDVFSRNPYALKLYDSLGYTRVGEAHWRMGEFFLMEKYLGKGENCNMLPTREEAEVILKEAEKCNPGPWGNHSRVAAHCAEKIAEQCADLDANKAYILGLLHDIGRKFGGRHLGHVADGYSYMMSLGYEEAAKICLTHSFNNQTTDEYIGNFDTTPEELKMIQEALKSVTMDEYDRLIQLCDSLAGSEGVLDIEERMGDVRRRYGSYPREKWDSNLALKKHFEEKMGKDIYAVVRGERDAE